jgi:hypothetical protein
MNAHKVWRRLVGETRLRTAKAKKGMFITNTWLPPSTAACAYYDESLLIFQDECP